ncbi:hypothetical protein MFLAVUS_009891 [Mucor flavus]|uniref:Sel1 repeat family protein n=1 Tax=Mucor flavus TaxID=439312 RepID=A0ABP9ZB67_9FUNG
MGFFGKTSIRFVHANANKKKGANSGKKTADDWYNKGIKEYDSENYKAALCSFLKSAESNQAKAQNRIGVLYQLGYGVDIDYNAALSWYLKSAEQGYSLAQYNIGVFYNRGYGVDVDYGVALSWYLKAAEQGHLDAKKEFIALYGRINGVKLEYNEARELFTKAAEGRNEGNESKPELELSELKREARESKEQIAILLAKLAIKDSEIKKITINANAAVPQIIHTRSTGIVEADLAQGEKDEEIQKQTRRKEPLKFFQL